MPWRAEPVTEFPARSPSELFYLLVRLAPFALFACLDLRLRDRRTMPEAERLIARLHDMAVMRQPIQQRRRHLGIAKYARPFSKGQVRRNHHACMLIELRQQMEEQSPAGLTEGQVAQFIKDNQIH